MSAGLDQALYDLTRGPLRDRFAQDRPTTIAATGLTGASRDALLAQDVEALWCAGAHPMLLLYFARACGIAAPDYYARVSRADAADPRGRPAEETEGKTA